MPNALTVAALGIPAGLIAAAAMDAFQTLAAKPFGATGKDDPATVKAADTLSKATTGRVVTQKRRAKAGQLVHYATGLALGIGYVLLVRAVPEAALGFGALFGIVTALVLDDLLVPAFGWGSWPTRTPLNIHAYSLASHIVFGLALEGVRRVGLIVLA